MVWPHNSTIPACLKNQLDPGEVKMDFSEVPQEWPKSGMSIETEPELQQIKVTANSWYLGQM